MCIRDRLVGETNIADEASCGGAIGGGNCLMHDYQFAGGANNFLYSQADTAMGVGLISDNSPGIQQTLIGSHNITGSNAHVIIGNGGVFVRNNAVEIYDDEICLLEDTNLVGSLTISSSATNVNTICNHTNLFGQLTSYNSAVFNSGILSLIHISEPTRPY